MTHVLARNPPSGSTIGSTRPAAPDVVPGLALAAAAVVVALIVHDVVAPLSPLVIATALGVVVANTVAVRGTVSDTLRPGFRVAARQLLRAGVVLLGFQLSLAELGALGIGGLATVALTVGVTFVGTRLIGRWLGISDGLSLLVATGYSICGASAIAAVEGVADADEEEVAFSIALVTLCGTLAIVTLPAIGSLLGLTDVAFGSWIGASVHDVGQVVAAATTGGGEAVEAAVVVKLTRVVLLAPLVAGLGLAARRRHVSSAGGGKRPATVGASRPPLVPLFVAGFLLAIAVRTTGIVPERGLELIKVGQTLLLSAALFALGCGVQLARLRRLGGRPLLLGLAAWVLVAGAALAGTQLLS